MEDFKKKFREFMFRNNLTIGKCAKLAGVSRTYLNSVLTGYQPISERMKYKMNELMKNNNLKKE